MARKRILFIGGSLNQTSIVYKISLFLKDFDTFFTPYYSDGFVKTIVGSGLLEYTILGSNARKRTEEFLADKSCSIDYGGTAYGYDLVVTCSDLIIPQNIKGKKIVLVQEGMTDPENIKYHLVKSLKLPRFLANTSMAGLSHAYQAFCAASEGFKRLFINKGVDPKKIFVTGIPSFDNVEMYRSNDFPHKNYVLAATSHLRECYKYENRKKFIQKVLSIANGHSVIFKLHPNERIDRAVKEIEQYAPGAMIYTEGNTNQMIANSDTLVTKYSSVLLVAAALRKKVYSDLDREFLEELTPIQNGGRSAEIIADICRQYLE